ncbi:unnamed protein product [Candida verbasci]|uniref:GATA-type domain-containing protein n=1 Tax=Candida verbasci TaxID=1227364 RepID=A0A9W4XGI3_9ASCO|nr:unnamed protein product [Candida verbasci]
MRLPSINELTKDKSSTIVKKEACIESSPKHGTTSTSTSTSLPSISVPISNSNSNYTAKPKLPSPSLNSNSNSNPNSTQPPQQQPPPPVYNASASVSASTSPTTNYQYYQQVPQRVPNQQSPTIHAHPHPQFPHHIPIQMQLPPNGQVQIHHPHFQPIYYQHPAHPHHPILYQQFLPPNGAALYPFHQVVPPPEIVNKPTNKCHRCGTTETPEWRRGPKGVRTLCNACGLYHAKLVKRKGAAVAAEEVLNNKVTKGKNGRRISLKKHLLKETLKQGEVASQVVAHVGSQLPPINQHRASFSLPPILNQANNNNGSIRQ